VARRVASSRCTRRREGKRKRDERAERREEKKRRAKRVERRERTIDAGISPR
jgi:hypothetical protein